MICGIVYIISLAAVGAEVRETIQEGIRLSEYDSFRSVSLVRFYVERQSVYSTWLFKAYSKPLGCPVQNVTIAIQQGGYPVISPRGETFPDNFYMHRSYQYNQTFRTQGQIMAFRMLNPEPGDWYAAAFLPDKDDGIKQKGFGASCTYLASASHVTHAVDDIPTVALNSGTTLHDITLIRTDDKYLVKYLLPKGVYRYDIRVTRCQVELVDFSDLGCPIRLLTGGARLPTEQGATTNCSEFTKEHCVHTEPRPVPLEWNYLGIYAGKPLIHKLTLNITLSACTAIELDPRVPVKRLHLRAVNDDASTDPTATVTTLNSRDDTTIDALNKTAASIESRLTDDSEYDCIINPLMDQSRITMDYFKFTYLMSTPNKQALRTNLTDAVTIFPFEVGMATLDGGGTLSIGAKVGPLKDQSQNVSVTWCLSQDELPLNGTDILCKEGLTVTVNTSQGVGLETIHIPYPESGMWYVAGKRQCYVLDQDDRPQMVTCLDNTTLADLYVRSTPCLDDKCGENGECRTFYSGTYFFSSCYCYSGYRGYLCNDAAESVSDRDQLAHVLLLTLSNIFFFPAGVLALYRRYFPQATVYFFTMFFSTFYHACDRAGHYSYCMLAYDVLSYCDFYGSILSACVTIIAMSKVNEPLRGVALTSSCLFLAFGVAYDKHSLWVFGVPVLVAFVMMSVAWGFFCRSRRTCYPPKWRYLTHIAPGACCALLGVLLFGFVETNANYPYVHSAWHALMACAVMFVLPPRSKRQLDSQESLLIGLDRGANKCDVTDARMISASDSPPSDNELI